MDDVKERRIVWVDLEVSRLRCVLANVMTGQQVLRHTVGRLHLARQALHKAVVRSLRPVLSGIDPDLKAHKSTVGIVSKLQTESVSWPYVARQRTG